MRAFLLGAVLLVPASIAAQSLEDLPAPVARRIWTTGSFSGSVKGSRDETLYNGDKVTETINCELKMEFQPDGTVTYTASDYFYEVTYYKKTTTGGYLVGHTRVNGVGSSGTRNSRLLVSVTQYGKVWNAAWQPRVDLPAEVFKESWREEHGRRFGHAETLPTNPTFYCEPKVLWRGKDGKGVGGALQGSYQGPDAVYPWATVEAKWDFRTR